MSILVPYIIHEASNFRENISANIIGETEDGAPIVMATLQDLGVENRNRRIYLPEDLIPQLKSERTVELIRTGNLKGENGHPMSNDLARQQTIDPNLVCCKFLAVWNEGNLIKAKVTGTNNDLGRTFNSDILSGELPSFSLRALGTMESRNGKTYVKNIKIITWDRVIYPSHRVAYTDTRPLTESGNMLFVDESYEGKIIPINNDAVIKHLMKESANIEIIGERFDVSSYDDIVYLENGYARLYNNKGQTILVKVEDFIRDQIREYCLKN